MQAGDWVEIVNLLANLDPDEFEDPLSVNIDRSPIRHTTFAFGPHRCVGSHLARRELAVALQQWLTAIPTFRLADDEAYRCHGGSVIGMDFLNLVWD